MESIDIKLRHDVAMDKPTHCNQPPSMAILCFLVSCRRGGKFGPGVSPELATKRTPSIEKSKHIKYCIQGSHRTEYAQIPRFDDAQ
jgi:hypothetical protein